MRNTLDGSKIDLGRKNRKNIKKQVVRNPAMLAQTIRRRILLTGGSGTLSATTAGPFGTTAGLGAKGVEGFVAGGRAGTPSGDSGVAVVCPGNSCSV